MVRVYALNLQRLKVNRWGNERIGESLFQWFLHLKKQNMLGSLKGHIKSFPVVFAFEKIEYVRIAKRAYKGDCI